jgi:hypothetical protein
MPLGYYYYFLRERCDVMVWIDLAERRDQWRALVKTVINLLVP